MSLRRLNINGDTIVEVLIAIAVVSMVLGGAYVSANKSLQQARAAQERGEAIKLGEAQLERLKVLISDPASAVFTTSNYFCIDDSNGFQDLGASPDLNDFSGPTYPSACKPAPVGGIRYHQSIKGDPPAGPFATGRSFTVRLKWDGATGQGIEELKFVYRVYK